MSNRAFLVANPSGDPEHQYDDSADVLLAASHNVPVFWLVLFEPKNRCIRTESWEDDDGKDELVSVPGFLCPRDEALERARKRADKLFEYLDPAARPLYDQFLEFLDGQKFSHVQIDAAEFGLLLVPSDLRDLLELGASAVDSGKPDELATLFDRDCLELDRDSLKAAWDAEAPSASADLRGYGWDRPVPWD